jgi:hypothetical protein
VLDESWFCEIFVEITVPSDGNFARRSEEGEGCEEERNEVKRGLITETPSAQSHRQEIAIRGMRVVFVK